MIQEDLEDLESQEHSGQVDPVDQEAQEDVMKIQLIQDQYLKDPLDLEELKGQEIQEYLMDLQIQEAHDQYLEDPLDLEDQEDLITPRTQEGLGDLKIQKDPEDLKIHVIQDQDLKDLKIQKDPKSLDT